MDREPEHRAGWQQDAVPFERTADQAPVDFHPDVRGAGSGGGFSGHGLQMRDGLSRQQVPRVGGLLPDVGRPEVGPAAKGMEADWKEALRILPFEDPRLL